MPWPKLRRSPEPGPQPDSPAAKRLRRLAERLDELPAKDLARIQKEQELERRQREGASDLYQMLRTLVDSLNRLMQHLVIDLTPDTFDSDSLYTASGALFQVNASGRILQVLLQATPGGASTEHFRQPYIIEGRLRWFNQELLDRQEIRENHLYYVVEAESGAWRYYNAHRHRTGHADLEYLAEILEELI